MHKTEPFQENEAHFKIQTAHLWQMMRPRVDKKTKKKNKNLLSIWSDSLNGSQYENKRKRKDTTILGLWQRTEKMMNERVTEIAIVIGAFQTVPKYWRNRKSEAELKPSR